MSEQDPQKETLTHLIPEGLTYPQMKEYLSEHDDIKFDPVFRAMVNGMGEAVSNMAAIAAKEGAEDIHEVMSYRRLGYTFNSSDVEEVFQQLAEAMKFMFEYKALSEEERTGPKVNKALLVKHLNTLTDASDALVNVGIHNPGTQPENIGPENMQLYFGALKVYASFVDTFLRHHGITVLMRPVFEDADVPEEFKLVQQPFFVYREGNDDSFEVLAAPCATHMPDWYILMNKFRTVAMEQLQDARIALEDTATSTIEDIEDEQWFQEDQSEK